MRWNVPDNVDELATADPYGIWDTHEYQPIVLSVMTGTVYGGRAIPLAWQIEFEPKNVENERAIRTIKHLGIEPDGYGWCKLVAAAAQQRFPELTNQLHTGDTEDATCVIWVETEEACRKLIGVAYELVAKENND